MEASIEDIIQMARAGRKVGMDEAEEGHSGWGAQPGQRFGSERQHVGLFSGC